MKTTSFLSSLLIALVLVFSACKKDEETKPDTEQEEEKNNEEEENTEEENTEEEEENTEEENSEEETEEENTGSYTKAQLVGVWSLKDPSSNSFCGGNSEVYTFKKGDDNAYLSCDNDPDPFIIPYSLNGDKLTMDFDIFGKPTFTIETLNETTLTISNKGSSETYIKQ